MNENGTNELPQQVLYYDHPREDVRPHIPPTARSALDVGCGKGGFGCTLREVLGPQARIDGVEATLEQATVAGRDHGFDEVIHGYFPQALVGRPQRYELICFNDVLEHLWEPWEVLRQTHRFLLPGGQVIAAIPNIQYAPTVWELLKGRWDYADLGILDRTHVRFFTKATMREMFEDTGYHVERCVGANNVGNDLNWGRYKAPMRHLLGNFQWMHFVVLARSTQVAAR